MMKQRSMTKLSKTEHIHSDVRCQEVELLVIFYNKMPLTCPEIFSA